MIERYQDEDWILFESTRAILKKEKEKIAIEERRLKKIAIELNLKHIDRNRLVMV